MAEKRIGTVLTNVFRIDCGGLFYCPLLLRVRFRFMPPDYITRGHPCQLCGFHLKNPRRHSDAQIAQIAGSIAHFGFNSPILIDAKGSIIAGHGPYLGALKLGLEMAPVIILDHLSEIETRAYLLADNKLAELSEWDEDTLASELAELKNADIDLGDLGFSDEELRLLLADAERRIPTSLRKRRFPNLPPSR
jgi:ParB-like chromosome segregation protein Spo0J